MESRVRRGMLSVTLLAVLLMACAAHVHRHLNLSGDEMYFYFLGMKEDWSDYRPHYERVRSQLAEAGQPVFSQLTSSQQNNFDDAQFYLGIEPQYFTEYTLPRLIWGTVSRIVAPTHILMRSDQDLSRGSADSIFFMLLAGYGIVCALVVAVTYRLSADTKTVLIVFVFVTFLKESFVGMDLNDFYRVFSPPVAVFLATPVWENKDIMAFGFSGRSLFLLLLVAYLGCRWEALFHRNVMSPVSYLMLPILTLFHATHGILVSGMFLVVDAVLGRRRLQHPVVLLSYAAAFGFALHGGSASKPWVFGALSILTTFLVATAAWVLGARDTAIGHHTSESGTAQKERWWKEAMLLGVFALMFLVSAHPVATALGVQGREYGWFVLLGMRLGSIFAVLILFVLSWSLVEAASGMMKPKTPFSLLKTGLVAACAPAAIMAVVAVTDVGFDLSAVRERLQIQGAAYLGLTVKPLSFHHTNELHVIWYSIIKSSIHNKSHILEVKLLE